MTAATQPVVETYNLHLNGHYVRKATRVTIGNRRVSFMELLPKRIAVPQARELLKRGVFDRAEPPHVVSQVGR